MIHIKMEAICFKIPLYMEMKIQRLLRRGYFKSKAEFFRWAIELLIDEEKKYNLGKVE